MVRMFEFLEVNLYRRVLNSLKESPVVQFDYIQSALVRQKQKLLCLNTVFLTKFFLLEKPLYINTFNLLKKVKRKLTGTW
jgi:hypothetical protein